MVRRGAVLAVAVVGVLLAGCDGGEPTDSPSGSSGGSSNGTTSASPTPSEEESTRAAAERGPVKTVRAWVRGMATLLESGDTSEIYALSYPACTTCDDLIEPRAAIYEEGGRIEAPGGVKVLAVGRDKNFASNKTVNAVIEYAAGRTWPSQGADPVEFQSERVVMRFEMTEVTGEWLVSAVLFP